MANSETFGLESDPAPQSVPVSRLAGWLGAMTSVALAGGLVWWVADLALRDARGVPVVRAIEGPSRVAPEEPGGFQAAHQGFAVNRIASDEEVPLADRVVLAPAPVSVAEEDLPLPELQPEARDAALRDAVGAALEEVLGADAPQPLPGALPGDGDGFDETADGADLPREEGAAGGRAGPGPALSPRPVTRPSLDIVTRAVADAAVPGAALVQPAALSAETIAPGTRLVQFGAYGSEAEALAAWERLMGSFESYMADKARIVERTIVADREYWRLRAHGFGDLAEARSFCAVLLAESADCIPVLTR